MNINNAERSKGARELYLRIASRSKAFKRCIFLYIYFPLFSLLEMIPEVIREYRAARDSLKLIIDANSKYREDNNKLKRENKALNLKIQELALDQPDPDEAFMLNTDAEKEPVSKPKFNEKEYQKKYRQTHKEQAKKYQEKYREKKKNTVFIKCAVNTRK